MLRFGAECKRDKYKIIYFETNKLTEAHKCQSSTWPGRFLCPSQLSVLYLRHSETNISWVKQRSATTNETSWPTHTTAFENLKQLCAEVNNFSLSLSHLTISALSVLYAGETADLFQRPQWKQNVNNYTTDLSTFCSLCYSHKILKHCDFYSFSH